MDLSDLLIEKKSPVLEKWCDLILEAYPEEGQRFFKKQKDQFANPVGLSIFEGAESIYDELLGEADSDKISVFLDNIIRVRAIQDLLPAQATGFIFGLKKIVREELRDHLQQEGISDQLAAFESRIDGLALMCFNVYTECRQRVFDIRVKELRNQSHKLLKMAGLAYELPENEGTLKEDNGNNG
ncbi:MAG: RsbRD N-terminal domain-containing protein [Thermodesulfobacteriota bacterium]|nr:RsbRD N-terminal domain-containing protein [Thermodesulfobacteriota bacterium]